MPEKYLTEAEMLHVIPSGKRILRDETWDRRYENYWIGLLAPELPSPNSDESYYWYDVAQDVVKKFDHAKTEWVPTLSTEAVPKLAFETKTWRHVGIVVEEGTVDKPASLKDLLGSEDDFS